MELLSPAGNYQAALSALNAGADAIYIGGKNFSARMSAENFSDEEVIDIINRCHILGKKVYVTMNTLIYQDEFIDAVKYAEFLHKNNVDALIIQDIGLAYYLHKVYPRLVLHASTQLNCHNLTQAKALKEVGFSRIVLARESNLEFAKQVKSLGIEVEVFIHGALCVAYSGNCLMSSFIGSRSGNRGKCAQPCRMKYSLCTENNVLVENYTISTKDLNTLDKVNQLINAGIDSLKIEGRLKQNQYVYLVTKAYRHALDSYLKNQKNNDYLLDQEQLQSIFSRKFTSGFIFNENQFNVLNQESSSHQGEKIGFVKLVKGTSVFIQLTKDIHRLDGIRFNDCNQYGRQIQKMFINNKSVDQAKKNQLIEIKNLEAKVKVNCEVIRTSSYLLLKQIDIDSKVEIKNEIAGKIICFKNKPLTFEVITNLGRIKKVGCIVEQSINQGTSKVRIIEQFSKLGNYPFILSKVDFKGDEDIFIPISEINKLKNEVIEEYITLINKNKSIIKNDYQVDRVVENKKIVNINSMCSTSLQNEIALKNNINSYSLDNNNLLNRITGEVDVNNKLIHYFAKGEQLIASQYCNITNSYSLDAYFSFGFDECILSLELDYSSIKGLILDYYSRHHIYPNVGLIIYGRNDMMIMKSCPIGTSFNNKNNQCGRCLKQLFYLKDRTGAMFPLLKDSNCNTRVLDYKILYLIDKIQELKELNIYNFYLNFTLENNDETKKIIKNSKDNLYLITNLYDDKYYKGHYLKRAL